MKNGYETHVTPLANLGQSRALCQEGPLTRGPNHPAERGVLSCCLTSGSPYRKKPDTVRPTQLRTPCRKLTCDAVEV